MSVEIRVPSLGESVTEATVAKWFKQIGEAVTADEPLVELETDKVTLEYNAPAKRHAGRDHRRAGRRSRSGRPARRDRRKRRRRQAGERPRPRHTAAAPDKDDQPSGDPSAMTPAVRKLIDESDVDIAAITPSGPKGNITKGDVLAAIDAAKNGGAKEASAPASDGAKAPETEPKADSPEQPAPKAVAASASEKPASSNTASATPAEQEAPKIVRPSSGEERVKMTRLRRRIAERLKEAQNTAAILTTYNEADMSGVIALRKRYRDSFEKKHGVKARLHVLLRQGDHRCASRVAGAERRGRRRRDRLQARLRHRCRRRHAERSGGSDRARRRSSRASPTARKTINQLGAKARDGKLAMDDLVGGTFTISNGGVYGSLMSSPILNPPQVGILGMHKIQERPVAIDGEIVIRPMMYLALSYDHRIVDGREAVTFLVRVKEFIEDPERLLLDI